MKLINLTCAFIAFININLLNAAWNPECLPIENKGALATLNSDTLTKLEYRVLDYVKTSWCSQEKAKLILELVILTRPKVCVEIGAFTGASTLPMLAGLQYFRRGIAYIVEPWSNAEAIRGLPFGDPNTTWWEYLDMSGVKKEFASMLNAWSLNYYCQILEKNSENAVSEIPSIDFLHIDGNFSEDGALLDSELYLPKVVPGGYILISNVLIMIGGKPAKMKALWPLFNECNIVCEIENGNVILFKKKK